MHPFGGQRYRSRIVNFEILGIHQWHILLVEHHLCFIMIQDPEILTKIL